MLANTQSRMAVSFSATSGGGAPASAPAPGEPTAAALLRAVRGVVGVPEPIGGDLRAGIRNMRVDVHLAAAVVEPPGDLVPPDRARPVCLEVRDQGGRAAHAAVIIPDLDVLEQRYVLLDHDRVEQPGRSGDARER